MDCICEEPDHGIFGGKEVADTGLSLKDSSAESHADCRGLAHESSEQSKDFNSSWARGYSGCKDSGSFLPSHAIKIFPEAEFKSNSLNSVGEEISRQHNIESEILLLWIILIQVCNEKRPSVPGKDTDKRTRGCLML